MKFLKIILISLISAVMVSASVVQYHHHDSHGNMCLSIFDYHEHSHHNSELPNHDHNCAAKISIMDFVEKVTDKCPVIVELQLLWSQSDLTALQPAVVSLFSLDFVIEDIFGIFELSGLGGMSFRAPPVAI